MQQTTDSNTNGSLWQYRNALDVNITAMRSANVRKNAYDKALSISVDLPLQYLVTSDNYNPSTLFGLKLTARKCTGQGAAVYATVHVQTSPHSQTHRIYKDYSCTVMHDSAISRVTAKALESLWLDCTNTKLLTKVLSHIDTHYKAVGIN